LEPIICGLRYASSTRSDEFCFIRSNASALQAVTTLYPAPFESKRQDSQRLGIIVHIEDCPLIRSLSCLIPFPAAFLV
jgi:hypothetical protein